MPLGDRTRQRLAQAMQGVTRTVHPRVKNVRFVGDPDEFVESAHTDLGFYYEYAHAALHGGSVVKDIVRDVSVRRLPDVIDANARPMSITEVKGTRISSQVQLRESQVGLYEKIITLWPQAIVRVSNFRHARPDIKTFNAPRKLLFQELPRLTLYEAIFSYDLALILHDSDALSMPNDGRPVPLSRKFVQNSIDHGVHPYETCTCLHAGTLTFLSDEPERLLTSLGVSPSDYRIRKYYAEDVHINRYKIDKFPVVEVMHRDYLDWSHQYSRAWFESHDADEDGLDYLVPLLARCGGRTRRHESLRPTNEVPF